MHEFLQAALAGVRIRLGVEATATSEGVVRWRSGGEVKKEQFDLVVGADGIGSTVRRSLWPDNSSPRYAGYSAWRGITSEPVNVRGEAGKTWGQGERFGIAPLRDGRIYWFAVATLPRDIRFVDEYAEVRRRFRVWHDPIGEVIAHTKPDDVFRRDICDLALPLSTYVRERVVLLGDAAHAMTPDLGQGGNLAMEDAATLATLLAPIALVDRPSAVQLAAALQRYDQLRRPRTQAIASQARALGALAHAGGPLRVFARDTLMRLVPPALIARRMLAIQSWQPALSS